MSRLDLLKKSTPSKSDKPAKPSNRGGMLGGSTKHNHRRKDDFDEDDLQLDDDAFENELADPVTAEYDIDDDQDDENEDVNIIELDIDLENNNGLGIESDLLDEDEDEIEDEIGSVEKDQINKVEDISESKNESHDRVEGKVIQDYSEDDILAEIEYSFETREEAYEKHVKVIQDGGLEISVSKVLNLSDIVRVSVTLSELKEQVGCEGRVVSVFPRNIRANAGDNQNRYIIQFVGPNASETERVLSKYLLGYKGK